MVFRTRSSNWNSADYCCRGTSAVAIKKLKKKSAVTNNDTTANDDARALVTQYDHN